MAKIKYTSVRRRRPNSNVRRFPSIASDVIELSSSDDEAVSVPRVQMDPCIMDVEMDGGTNGGVGGMEVVEDGGMDVDGDGGVIGMDVDEVGGVVGMDVDEARGLDGMDMDVRGIARGIRYLSMDEAIPSPVRVVPPPPRSVRRVRFQLPTDGLVRSHVGLGRPRRSRVLIIGASGSDVGVRPRSRLGPVPTQAPSSPSGPTLRRLYPRIALDCDRSTRPIRFPPLSGPSVDDPTANDPYTLDLDATCFMILTLDLPALFGIIARPANRKIPVRDLPEFVDWLHVISDPIVVKVYAGGIDEDREAFKRYLVEVLRSDFGMTLTPADDSLTLSRS